MRKKRSKHKTSYVDWIPIEVTYTVPGGEVQRIVISDGFTCVIW